MKLGHLKPAWATFQDFISKGGRGGGRRRGKKKEREKARHKQVAGELSFLVGLGPSFFSETIWRLATILLS